MFDILCVSNSGLVKDDFLARIKNIACSGVDGIILREKHLTADEYALLAVDVMEICRQANCKCILHGFADVALRLGVKNIHLPMDKLRLLDDCDKQKFKVLGASCHSVEEATEAQKLGCTYITAGHIFDTDCKKGVAGRGLDFLADVCKSVSIPVYAIGGVSAANVSLTKSAGAKGACVMSGFMTCKNVKEFFGRLKDGQGF